MARCLIVANQTLGGAQLEQEVAACLARGTDDFYIVVPMVPPQYETVAFYPDDAGFAVAAAANDRASQAVAEARERSRERLADSIERIRAAGAHADGEVGSTYPLEAVRAVLERDEFDEVVVSTLPAGLSRWLRMDLPNRVARLVDCPVTTVEAERARR